VQRTSVVVLSHKQHKSGAAVSWVWWCRRTGNTRAGQRLTDVVVATSVVYVSFVFSHFIFSCTDDLSLCISYRTKLRDIVLANYIHALLCFMIGSRHDEFTS
jgi:hypothetical protein